MREKITSLVNRYRLPAIFFCGGFILLFLGLSWLLVERLNTPNETIEVLNKEDKNEYIVFEISGAVDQPGVYRMPDGVRIIDAIKEAKGLTKEADKEWIEKNVNKASPIADGQKIYLPIKSKNTNSQSSVESASNMSGDQSRSAIDEPFVSNLININSATQKELDTLPGIGPVYAQSIIEHRPYSSVDELLKKGVLKEGVYEKIKSSITVF